MIDRTQIPAERGEVVEISRKNAILGACISGMAGSAKSGEVVNLLKSQGKFVVQVRFMGLWVAFGLGVVKNGV